MPPLGFAVTWASQLAISSAEAKRAVNSRKGAASNHCGTSVGGMRTCSPKSIGPHPAAGPDKTVTLVSCRLSNNRWKAVPGRPADAHEAPEAAPR
ncbi:hypothetical protein GCM10009825_12990 [Arthrobacter humicola]|uniref:Secreted protein n=1 Tax=Arthrobacter humicola TaxID=409291 RepID=A0ABP5KIS3_9MICC